MYVCFIIVHLPSFGCETSCQILNHSGVQACIWVHTIQGQEIYLAMYMYITLAACKLRSAVPICCDFHTSMPGDVPVIFILQCRVMYRCIMPVQYIFYALSHTDILHISHLSILLNLVITISVYVTSCL